MPAISPGDESRSLLAEIERQSEIQQLGLQVRAHQNIGGLQVAVNDALLVQELDGQHDLEHQFGLLFEGERARPPVSGAPSRYSITKCGGSSAGPRL